MIARPLPLVAILCAGCAGSSKNLPPAAPAAKPQAAAPAAPPEPPTLRLPRTFVPESNALHLRVDPASDRFDGEIQIAARTSQPVTVIWLDAEHLTVEKASAAAGGKTVPLEVLPQPKSFVGLRAAEPIPAGPVTLSLRFSGKIYDKETEGIFRQKEGDAWYAFSQFEPISARRAFPCFDEPDSKVPWQVTLEVPEGLVAVSNTPVVSETPTGRGGKTVVFAKTPPLPSYLVAFAVGPFDAVDAGRTRQGRPVRILVPRGRAGDSAFVAETTGPIVDRLEDYFGSPYPFDKLDLLAIPLTAGFGAMENPGLVTFNQSLLVARRADFSISFQRAFASVAAHELAHQWFGDLVTLAWWDDVWLNEAFAEWMADKLIRGWKPEWGTDVADVAARGRALASDSLPSARKVRQPIASEDDIENAFDAITYQKGAAVIGMFEHAIGEDRFRDGVRAYLAAHTWGNATAADLLAALGAAAGKEVAAPFSTFLDQPGAPLVTVELACKKGGAPHLVLQQERYVPQGAQGVDPNQTWQVPICVKAPEKGKAAGAGVVECTVLAEKRKEWTLERIQGCPDWLLPNDGGIGYYRSALAGDLMPRLLRGLDRLSLAERVAVIGDVSALVSAGRVDVSTALAFVPRYAAHESRHLVNAVAEIATRIRIVVPDELADRYARFVRKLFGARAHKLGWKPAPGEDDDTRLLRKTLLGLVAVSGEDAQLGAQARELALAWIADHSALDPEMVSAVLGAAAHHGDAALYERFYQAAKAATDRKDRQILLSALSGFRSPALAERSIQMVTSGEFDTREAIGLFFGGLSNPSTRRLVYDALKAHYDVLAEKMPRPFVPYLVFAGVAQCDAKLKPDVEAFFKDRTSKAFGGPRIYAQAMEAMDQCIRQREAQRPGVVAFLKKY